MRSSFSCFPNELNDLLGILHNNFVYLPLFKALSKRVFHLTLKCKDLNFYTCNCYLKRRIAMSLTAHATIQLIKTKNLMLIGCQLCSLTKSKSHQLSVSFLIKKPSFIAVTKNKSFVLISARGNIAINLYFVYVKLIKFSQLSLSRLRCLKLVFFKLHKFFWLHEQLQLCKPLVYSFFLP